MVNLTSGQLQYLYLGGFIILLIVISLKVLDVKGVGMHIYKDRCWGVQLNILIVL